MAFWNILAATDFFTIEVAALRGLASFYVCIVRDRHCDAPRGDCRCGGYRLTVVVVMTPVLASVRTVQNTIHLFGTRVDYIAVRNLAFGEPAALCAVRRHRGNGTESTSELRQTAAARWRRGQVIDLPALAPSAYALLNFHNVGFSAAQDDPRVPRADRARVRQCSGRFAAAIESAKIVLGA